MLNDNIMIRSIDQSVIQAAMSLTYGAEPEILVDRYASILGSDRLGRWVVKAAEILLEKDATGATIGV